MKKSILCVDDDESILRLLYLSLEKARIKWDMVFVNSGREALKMLSQKSFDVIVTDYVMPEMNGIELLKEAKKRYKHIKRVFLTGNYQSIDEISSFAHKCILKNNSIHCIENELEEILKGTGPVK